MLRLRFRLSRFFKLLGLKDDSLVAALDDPFSLYKVESVGEVRRQLLGPVRFVFREPGSDELDGLLAEGEGFGGVSLFRQVFRGDVLPAGGVDWGESEGQELDLLVRDARVDNEDQGLVAKDGDEQQ